MNASSKSLILGIVSLLGLVTAAIASYLAQPYPLLWQISLGVAVATGIGFLVLERKGVAGQLGRKSTQFGIHTLVLVLLSVGVVAMINLISNRYDVKKDITKNKLHTLSEQTIKVLKGLNQEITLKLFVSPQQQQEYDRIINRYTAENAKLKREFVDIDKDRHLVEKYQVKNFGTMLIESSNRSSKVDNISGVEDPKFEEKLTNAIIQVAKGSKRKVYFVTGHGERMVSDSGRDGYSQSRDDLQNGRYEVAELMLLDKDKIPADAEILVVAGPKTDFMEHELKLLDGYVRQGGKLFFMVEPTSSPKLKAFLASFGAEWNAKRAIVEMNPLQQLAGGNPLTPIVGKYDGGHEITREIAQPSIFAVSTPVEKAKTTPEGLNVTSLFSTGPQSFEVPLEGNKVQVNQKTDRRGPLSLALAITGKASGKTPPTTPAPEGEKPADPEFRMLVVGDSDFASNSVRGFGMNSDLFQNMLSWLAHEEDLIAVRPKATDEAKLEVTEQRLKVINFASIIGLPLMMFLSGLFVFLKRRRM